MQHCAYVTVASVLKSKSVQTLCEWSPYNNIGGNDYGWYTRVFPKFPGLSW